MTSNPSGFIAFSHIGDDAHVTAEQTHGGAEAVLVKWGLHHIPYLYIDLRNARELRDALTVVLAEIEQAEIDEASTAFHGAIQAYGEHLGGAS